MITYVTFRKKYTNKWWISAFYKEKKIMEAFFLPILWSSVYSNHIQKVFGRFLSEKDKDFEKWILSSYHAPEHSFLFMVTSYNQNQNPDQLYARAIFNKFFCGVKCCSCSTWSVEYVSSGFFFFNRKELKMKWASKAIFSRKAFKN